MISKSYEDYKKEVLDIYNEYVNTFKKFKKGKINKSIIETAGKIEKEIFNIMVLGEAKSGKSTFINAYLGKEILPMDVRQCTSAIINIHYGDEFKLLAKTAAGGQKVVIGENEIKKFLKENASILDKYREIPITTINNELLIKKGIKNKKISEKDIKDLLKHVENENIYNIEIEKYKELIREYIENNKDNWGKIITEFDITYRLSEVMKGYTIVDSPGVGAGGNVGEITENYIKNANAIIFVKYLQGQALESKQFMSLIRSNVSKKQKEFLFLLFNGKSDLSEIDLTKLKKQAKEMYKNDIEEEKILFIDSKIQLFLNKCLELKTSEKIDEFFENSEKEGNNFESAELCWLKSKLDVRKFEDSMIEKSDFRSVNIVIEKFAMKARFIQLIKFLNTINKEYRGRKATILELLKELRENIKDPEALENRIKKKEKEKTEAYNKMNKDIHKIFNKYTDNINGSQVDEKFENLESSYKKDIEDFVNLSEYDITDQTFDKMKKFSNDTIDEINKSKNDIINQVIEECNNKLIEYEGEIDAEIFTPNFTESDFDNINAKAKEDTSGFKDIEEGVTFKKTTQVPYYHKKEHVKLVANSIKRRLYEEYEDEDGKFHNGIIPEIKNNIINYINICRGIYTEKLTENFNNIKAEYENLLKDKNDNKKNLQKIKNFEEEEKHIKKAFENIQKLNKEIDNYAK